MPFLNRYKTVAGKNGLFRSWAADQMKWAVSVRLIKGMENGTLLPEGTATRAQIAQVLMNYDTSSSRLNAVERANLDTIVNYERKMGWK